LISGRGSNMVSILEAIQHHRLDAEVKLVFSNNPQAEGLNRAQSFGVPTIAYSISEFDSKESYEQALIHTIRSSGVELIILAGYMRVLGRAFIQAFEGRILNIHPSLLPSFKGLHAQRQALDYGVKKAGCTVHYVNEEVDSGKIVDQGVVDVLPDDSEDSLSARILEVEHAIYPRAIQSVIEERRRTS